MGLPSVSSLGCSSPVCSSLICLRDASYQTPLEGPRISKASAFTIVCLEPTDPACSLEKFRGKTFLFLKQNQSSFRTFCQEHFFMINISPLFGDMGKPYLTCGSACRIFQSPEIVFSPDGERVFFLTLPKQFEAINFLNLRCYMRSD